MATDQSQPIALSAVLNAFTTNSQANLKQKLWANERLAQAELVKSSPPLNDEARRLTVALWLDTLLEIGEERFDLALTQALKSSTFRPDIAEIRRAAGVNAGIVDPVREEALAAMRGVIEAMRGHGAALKVIRGGWIEQKCGKCQALRLTPHFRLCQHCGEELPAQQREPDVPPPALGEHTEAAILRLGYGDRACGLESFSALPQLTPAESRDESAFRNQKVQEGFEERWVASWRATA